MPKEYILTEKQLKLIEKDIGKCLPSQFRSRSFPIVRPVSRRVLEEFCWDMENKLRENDYKGNWSECNYSYLIQRLREEVDELDEVLACFVIGQAVPRDLGGAYSIEQYGEVVEECADVANFAMMIADNLKNERETTGDIRYFTSRVIGR